VSLFGDPDLLPARALWQPYAGLVRLGFKTIETVSTQTTYRGQFLITAAWVMDVSARVRFRHVLVSRGLVSLDEYDEATSMHGVAMAVATIADVRPLVQEDFKKSFWWKFEEKRYGWLLDDVKKVRPFNVRAMPGFFGVKREAITQAIAKVGLPIIKTPGEWFDCTPYEARLEAKACVQRQRRAAQKLAPKEAFSRGPMGDYRRCVRCPLGQHVASELGEVLPEFPALGKPFVLYPPEKKPKQPTKVFPRRTPPPCPKCGAPHWHGQCADEAEEDEDEMSLSDEDRERQLDALQEQVNASRERRKTQREGEVRPRKKHCGLCGARGHNRTNCPGATKR
jgi:hypothetical protein